VDGGLARFGRAPQHLLYRCLAGASRQTITAYLGADSNDPTKWLRSYDEEINERLVGLFTEALGSVALPDDRNGDENSMFQEKRLTLRPWTEETAPAALVAV
jgi:hypothetical protein